MESWFICSEIEPLLASVSDYLKKIKALDIESIFVSISTFAAAATVATSANTTNETDLLANASTDVTGTSLTPTAIVASPYTAVTASASPANLVVFFALTF